MRTIDEPKNRNPTSSCNTQQWQDEAAKCGALYSFLLLVQNNPKGKQWIIIHLMGQWLSSEPNFVSPYFFLSQFEIEIREIEISVIFSSHGLLDRRHHALQNSQTFHYFYQQ